MPDQSIQETPEHPPQAGAAPHQDRDIRLLLGAFFLSGAAALMYEVLWSRALSLVLGSTVYAVSTMLSTFMAGLALGGYLGGKLADRTANHMMLFGLFELGIGITGLLSLPLIYKMPYLYLHLYRGFHMQPAVFFTLQTLLCAAVMLVPTTLMGATFPLVSRGIARDLAGLGRAVGNAYSFNTLGAVLGSLAAGFFLIPYMGMKTATAIAAALNALVGLTLLLKAGKPRVAASLLLMMGLASGALYLAEKETNLLNFYHAYRSLDGRPYEALVASERMDSVELLNEEAAEGSVRAIRTEDGSLLLQVGGKIEGTYSLDIPNTVLLAYLPIASHPSPKSFLTIGLGAGVTLGSARQHMKDVELVEINPSVIKAVRLYGKPGLLEGINIATNDARNHLMRTERKYDIISSEPSYPTESSVANLFTTEYYQIAASALNKGGIYCQWLPYYIMSNADVTMMLKTFTSVFPHTYVWKMPEALDLILVGSQTPIEYKAEAIMARVGELNTEQLPLSYVLSRTPEQLASLQSDTSVPMNTDDRPRLEFRIAENILLGDLSIADRRTPASPN